LPESGFACCFLAGAVRSETQNNHVFATSAVNRSIKSKTFFQDQMFEKGKREKERHGQLLVVHREFDDERVERQFRYWFNQ
jgi:hypothetical protein